MSGLTIVFIFLGHFAADKILKLYGLSRSGVVIETRSRYPFNADGDDALDEVVEVRMSSGVFIFLVIGCFVMGLFLLASPWVMSKETGVMRWLGMGMGIFLLIGFVYYLWYRKTPLARVDTEGVTSYRNANAMRQVFVPWSDVQTCEFQTMYDTFGKPILIKPVLRGRNGEKLMEINLLHAPMAQQEKLAKFIKMRLPKPQVDPWEL